MQYSNYITNEQIEATLNPAEILSMSAAYSHGTLSNGGTEAVLDYLWENYSDFFSVYRKYSYIKQLEKENQIDSEDLFTRWKNSEIRNKNYHINDWISSYLKIRNFVRP